MDSPLLKQTVVNVDNYSINESTTCSSSIYHFITKYKCLATTLLLFFVLFLIAIFYAVSNALPFPPSAEETKVEKYTSYYSSDYLDDVIVELPLLVSESCAGYENECSIDQYSGYLLANDDREIHYWFVQASRSDYLTRPVFVWTNGGPGCSGMEGMLNENGPWMVYETNTLHYNPYSWNTEPYGVGFSVADEGTVVAGDEAAAEDMDAVIRSFLTKFSQFASNEIYLSSESWGGHYVPMTSLVIMKNNLAGSTPEINYKGFLLGNPYTNEYENAYGFVGGIYGHGLLDTADWDEWRNMCWDNTKNLNNLAACSAIYMRAYYSAYNTDLYALDFENCPRDESWSTAVDDDSKHLPLMGKTRFMKGSHIHLKAAKEIGKLLDLDVNVFEKLNVRIARNELENILQRFHTGVHVGENVGEFDGKMDEKYTKQVKKEMNALYGSDTSVSGGVTHYVRCADYHLHNYLNLEDVQSALNVKPTTWMMCSTAVSAAWPGIDYEHSMQKNYKHLVNLYGTELKMMVYSGDDDCICGTQGTLYWLQRMDTWSTETEWEAWEDTDEQLGGYYTKYIDTETGNTALHFSTVHTAGHMVPSCQPQRSLSLLKKFLYEYE